jgi:hypothetical protein
MRTAEMMGRLKELELAADGDGLHSIASLVRKTMDEIESLQAEIRGLECVLSVVLAERGKMEELDATGVGEEKSEAAAGCSSRVEEALRLVAEALSAGLCDHGRKTNA